MPKRQDRVESGLSDEERSELEMRDLIAPQNPEFLETDSSKCSNHPEKDSVLTVTHDDAHQPQYFCRECVDRYGYGTETIPA